MPPPNPHTGQGLCPWTPCGTPRAARSAQPICSQKKTAVAKSEFSVQMYA